VSRGGGLRRGLDVDEFSMSLVQLEGKLEREPIDKNLSRCLTFNRGQTSILVNDGMVHAFYGATLAEYIVSISGY
jgi:hypothetical protein